MEVIPAIDLRGGRVVRLYQGDFSRETAYSDDPVAVALGWQKAGASRIHIVDLEGAVAGRPVNLETVKKIAARVDVPLQLGGAIRDLGTATKLVRMGISRVVFGTAAVRDPGLVKAACETLGGDAVVVGVDARKGKVAVQGWTETVSADAEDLIKAMTQMGVRRFIYTDIAADGTLSGPNVEAVAALMEATDAPIISAGGIGSMDDLERLAEVGVEGAIVGVALYTGDIDLREAIRRFGSNAQA